MKMSIMNIFSLAIMILSSFSCFTYCSKDPYSIQGVIFLLNIFVSLTLLLTLFERKKIMQYVSLGQYLKSIRKNIGWSYDDLSKKTGICIATLRKIEKLGRPRKSHLNKLMKVFLISENEMLNNKKIVENDQLFLANNVEKSYYSWKNFRV